MCAMEPDDLYGLPLDRFVPERGALAKVLRADGRRDEAARVAALRKPSVAAWAVNQLARTRRAGLRELLAAGDELRDAQEALLAGRGDARKLRAAGEREREAVDQLVGAARGLLGSTGEELSESAAERVAETLHAAALEPDAREAVSAGRLERELRHVGLGLGPGELGTGAPAAPRGGGKQRADESAPTRARRGAAEKPAGARAKAAPRAAGREERAATARAERERAAAVRAEAERAERDRAAARKVLRAEERDARRRAERAARGLRATQERRDKAAAALAEADEALGAARAEAEAAVREHDAAQAALERGQ